MKTKKSKNKFIYWWNRFVKKFCKGLEKNGINTDGQIAWTKRYAEQTYSMLEDKKPNKDKTMKEQANPEQLEFIEYLESIIYED